MVAWVPMALDGVDVGSTVQQVDEILPLPLALALPLPLLLTLTLCGRDRAH